MSELKTKPIDLGVASFLETTGIKKLTIDMSQWRLLND
jgi:hypothetical protein